MNFLKVTGIFLVFTSLLISCKGKTPFSPAEIEAERIAIDSTTEGDTSIQNFIDPYQEHLNKTLDSTLAYNPKDLSKEDGHLETAIGNLMADIVIQQASSVVKNRTGKHIDMVLLNHGGIRSTLNRGGLSTRSAYALMPFENEIVVAELSGKKMKEMLSYLEEAKTAHPVSGIRIIMDKNYKITEALINNKKIDTTKTYMVATSDFLQQGGDNMNFFKDPVGLYHTDYKLRNAIIDYFEKTDTIKAEKDGRFIQKK
ncbi:5'-nucleotidase C-terminal domain-containing protein [Salegentibacter chungangensis]|uniref:5'-nucleotidase C-terminal domain-containing protein n=1 Tax=Salegentibacter chungangensis TaxID=1335724 RepID=A0ABW3NRP1_9FLAO